MRNFTTLGLATALLLAACSDSTGPSGPPVKDTLFTQTWANGELSAMAYDPTTDALFLIEDVHSGENVIHRWSFADAKLREVYRSTSQHDYGMRLIDGELWVTRTYDNVFLRLGNLDQDTLTETASYAFPGESSLANEACDVAKLGGNVLFVAGNPIGVKQHDGIQFLTGPSFTSIGEFLSEAEAGWYVPDFGFFRSLVVVGSGPETRVVVTTGSRDGILVSYDLQGDVSFEIAGFGDSHLQKDSQDRIYSIDGDTGTIVRWSDDFQEREDFRYPAGGRFVLRETDANVEFIYADFRSEKSVVRRIKLPK